MAALHRISCWDSGLSSFSYRSFSALGRQNCSGIFLKKLPFYAQQVTDTQCKWPGVCWYLFGRVGRLGEDSLPVRPYKHDEREVEEDQVDNWRGTQSQFSQYVRRIQASYSYS